MSEPMATTEAENTYKYEEALREAVKELVIIDRRRQALRATIVSLSRLVDDGAQFNMGIQPEMSVSIPPKVPPNFFKDKKPTQAYRDFAGLFGEGYKPPVIRDAFIEGGMEATSKSALLATIHSVLARERKKKEREGGSCPTVL